MIKYIGSKRRLVPVLGAIGRASGARTALDAFTGTTRVAQELKRQGVHVTAVDSARYAHAFAQCYVETDARGLDLDALAAEIARLDALPGRDGYCTEVFCETARFFQPFNGQRIDAIRDEIEARHRGTPLFAVLLTSLIEAADRVDSTTGVQMAYVKQWAARSYKRMELRVPELLAGDGLAVHGDILERLGSLGSFDLAYLDPPYNQHRYFTNYHVWETLSAWDAPDHYGVACKRVDARDPSTKSAFNAKRTMPDALARTIRELDAQIVIVSYNDESWLTLDELVDMCRVRGDVIALGFAHDRYVGARIGVHSPTGEKVGTVSHTRNVEYVLVAGAADAIRRATAPVCEAQVATTISRRR